MATGESTIVVTHEGAVESLKVSDSSGDGKEGTISIDNFKRENVWVSL